MAEKKNRSAQTDATHAKSNSERLTNLVALLVVKGEEQVNQIRILAAAGYSNTDIAALLGITANAVNIALHRLRKKH